MKVTLNEKRKEKWNPSYRKDLLYRGYKVLDLDTPSVDGYCQEIVDCRLYAPGYVVYCCIWVQDSYRQIFRRGSAGAVGHGYHKTSAAIESAAYNAGYDFDTSFGGAGEAAEKKALMAIARLTVGDNRRLQLVEMFP